MHLEPTKYFGKNIYSRKLENYYVSLSRHNYLQNIPLHNHSNPYFSLNIGASYLENNLNSKRIIKPGKVIFRPNDYKHQNCFGNNSGICFNIELLNKNNRAYFNRAYLKMSFLMNFGFFKLLAKLLSDYTDNEMDCLITEFLQELDCHRELNQKFNSRSKPNWYKTIIEKIEEEYSICLTIDQIAVSVGLHPNYIARKFKSIEGITIGDYIRKTRLKKAALMFNSKESLTRIGTENGFYDQSHFIKSFKSEFDINPKLLQKLIQG